MKLSMLIIIAGMLCAAAGCGKSESRTAIEARIEQAKKTMSDDMLRNMDDEQKKNMVEGWAEGLRGQFSAEDVAIFQAELKKHYGIR